jgi:acyl-coenzyme A thioesterase PaaI-like protein
VSDAAATDAKGRAAIIVELGMLTRADGALLRGEAQVVPEICVPGTTAVRASVLATWADVLTGFLAIEPMSPQIPLTLDLDVHIHRQATSGRDILGVSSVVKAGRRIVVCDVRFHERGDDEPFAIGHGTFMGSPAPGHEFPKGFMPAMQERHRLDVPLAERAGVVVLGPGEVEVPRQTDGLNATGAIQGGLVALAAEEAVRATGERLLLSSLSVRYLRPFSVGPAHAVAERHGDLVTVRLRDAGQDKLGAIATAHLAPT